MKNFAAWVLFLCGSLLATSSLLATTVPACTQAQVQSVLATFGQVGQTVLDDVVAGKALEAIVTDVGALGGMVGKDVATIVNLVLSELISAGVIPSGSVPHAQELLVKSAANLAARSVK